MSEITFAIPGDLDLPTGGYGYDRRLLREWRETGVTARHLALPGSFPNPSEADLAETERLLRAQPDDSVLLIDGLAYGALPESLAAGLAGRIVALVHHPLGLETGLTPEQASAFIARETAVLRHASAVIVTSPATKRLLIADFAVPEARIAVALPGVDPAKRASGGQPGEPLQLLAVGSLVPRKGYDVLVKALASLANRPWRLTIIGAADRSPATARALAEQIEAAGLRDRVALTGAISDEELAHAYDAADLFVMPSLFEGYGMVLTEALARGLPILCTTGGAAAETAPDAAALKVPPGDAAELAKALQHLIDEPGARLCMADAAWTSAATLPRWREAATIVAEICRKVR
ncbi:glycosyltransferase family 1 protein [Bosea caraganae]|uniref:Glycosyltransferase family 1 protein n=1 Tax=Bosea caraganae TaxID=2763117 RepID=A0A370L6G4_9HYPH|nr:glycosyltransferase family 4 protein [Bosea caraganae]RDJ25350.1 glycosyltransferase family 1 protein [Bosea caraganae]RDJ25865.1 glycosyltransferase family 1 protein [Bosea caraganae]